MHTHRGVQIVATAVITAVAQLTGVAAPVARADNCADIHLVYARGTSTIPPIDPVGQALFTAISVQAPGKSMSVYGVNYPANFDLNGGSTTGATDAWVHIQNVVAACPDTRLVLGGYSQGADVIDLITTTSGAAFGSPTPMPPTVVSHVAAVVVFGNPSRKVGGGPLPARSALYGSKAVDFCMTGDPICSDGYDLTAHNKYISAGLVDQGARFAASQLAPRSA